MASENLRTVVSTRKAPGPSPHNSQAIVVNGPLIFVSGQMGVDVHTNELVKGNIKERVRMTLRNLEAVLYAAGSDLTRIVKINIFLTDMTTYNEVNEAYNAILPDPKPARTCVSVKELPRGTDVEIECVAQQ